MYTYILTLHAYRLNCKIEYFPFCLLTKNKEEDSWDLTRLCLELAIKLKKKNSKKQ